MKIRTTRELTTEECDWLDEAIPTGTELFIFGGATYGCITPEGIAVSEVDGENPFFEIPRNSYEYV